MKRIVFGITGASGAPYAEAILSKLSKLDCQVTVVASSNGEEIFRKETGKELQPFISQYKNMALECVSNFFSPIASGGNVYDVIICPSSMGFLARTSCGMSQNLLERAVDVALKERRKVVFVTRESPLSLIHLENMLNLTKAGATIMPASPFFYFNPKEIRELIDDFADRVLKVFWVDYEPEKRWG